MTNSVERTQSFAQNLAAYLPVSALRRILDDMLPFPGESDSVLAVILYVDLSALGPIIEMYNLDIPQNIDALSGMLHRLYTSLMDSVQRYSGIVAAFDDDEFTAYFRLDDNISPQHLILDALACAADVQSAIAQEVIEIQFQRQKLTARVGMSYGPLTLMSVGDTEHGLKFCLGGGALSAAASAAQHASRNGIVVHSSLYDVLGDLLPIESSREGFYTISIADVNVSRPLRETLDPYVPPETESALSQVLPAALVQRLRATRGPLAERRRVVDMFVAFTAPDYDSASAGVSLQKIITEAGSIARRFGGFICEILTTDKGSRLHIVFGALAVGDDNPIEKLQRALSCALALQAAPTAQARNQRIGMAQGTVFAGTVGSSHRRQYLIIGDTVKIAARLTDRAQPGQIIVDESIQSIAETDYQFDPLSALMIKGKTGPISAFLFQGIRTVDDNLAARYLVNKRPAVGRDAEIALLTAEVEAAIESKGRIVSLVGPAGVGKSRLVEEIVRQWMARDGGGYIGPSFLPNEHTPYFAWIHLWSSVFGLLPTDPSDVRRNKLLNMLKRLHIDDPTAEALFCAILNLPNPDTALLPQNPARFQRYYFALASRMIRALASEKPLLLVFDNLQWTDSGTLALLDYIAARIADLPVLIVSETRTAPVPDDEKRSTVNVSSIYSTLPNASRISILPLNSEDSWRLVENIVGKINWSLPILDKMESSLSLSSRRKKPERRCNPLWIEQAIFAMIRVGAIRQIEDRFELADSDLAVTIDFSESALLAGSTGNLDAVALNVIENASVIGPDFTFSFLRAMLRLTDDELWALLDRLNAAEITILLIRHMLRYRRDTFRHIPVQEAIYQSLPPSQRMATHAAIADEMLRHQRDGRDPAHGYSTDFDNSIVAFHYDRAERFADAARFSVQAGIQARSVQAATEALHHFAVAERNLLRLWKDEQVAPGLTTTGIRLQLLLNRGKLYIDLERYEEGTTDLDNALTLAQAANDTLRQAQVLNERARLHYELHNAVAVFENSDQAIAIAEKYKHLEELANGLRWRGAARYMQKQLTPAFLTLQDALSTTRTIYMPGLLGEITGLMSAVCLEQFNLIQTHQYAEEASNLLRIYGDFRQFARALGNLATVDFYWGNNDQALNAIHTALAVMEGSEQLPLYGILLNRHAAILCQMGQYREASKVFEEVNTISSKLDDPLLMAIFLSTYARECEREIGRVSEALGHLENALPVLQEGAAPQFVIESLLALADCHLRQANLDSAKKLLPEIDALITQTKRFWYRPETNVIKAQIALAEGAVSQASKFTYAGLSAVGDQGDIRVLSPLYRLLGAILERNRDRAEDMQDALERAILVGRTRARRLDLAWALHQGGLYYKHYTSRPTVRARGSGYLFEAERMFNEMGIPAPPTQSTVLS